MSNVKDEYLLLAVIIVYFYICRHLGLEMNRWISVRAQAGVEMGKKNREKVTSGGRRRRREDRFCGGWQVSPTAQCVGQQRGGQAEKD